MTRGVPIFISTDISGTDMLNFTVLVIGTVNQGKPIQMPIIARVKLTYAEKSVAAEWFNNYLYLDIYFITVHTIESSSSPMQVQGYALSTIFWAFVLRFSFVSRYYSLLNIDLQYQSLHLVAILRDVPLEVAFHFQMYYIIIIIRFVSG